MINNLHLYSLSPYVVIKIKDTVLVAISSEDSRYRIATDSLYLYNIPKYDYNYPNTLELENGLLKIVGVDEV